jgi:integrase/recombinase XerD
MTTHRFGPPAFARAARNFVRHYRALGFRYKGVEHALQQLGRFLQEQHAADLNSGLYEQWRITRKALHANSRRKSEQIVHRFCNYRRRSEPKVFVPSPDGFSRPRPYVRPVIVEPEQIARMMQAAATLGHLNCSPLRPAAARVAVVLLYTAGLRMGELLRLRVQDIEDDGSVLHICESKFHKSRLVPLSTSAQSEVRRYLERRARFAPRSPDRGPFLCHVCGRMVRAYSAPGFQHLTGKLFQVADIRDHEGRRPRLHDLRHSFAVQSLILVYRRGGDPQSLLPKLSLYLGHVSIASTLHYLKLVPELATLASARFDAAFGQVLGEQP